jgi:hypothetical protein
VGNHYFEEPEMKDNNNDYEVISRLIAQAWNGRVSDWIMIDHTPQQPVIGQRDTHREEDARPYVVPPYSPTLVLS